MIESNQAVHKSGGAGRKSIRNLYWTFLFLPALLFLIIIYVYPIGNLLSLSLFDPHFTTAHFERIVNESMYSQVFLITFKLAFIVTCICLILGYPIAYVLNHVSSRTASFLILLILIPLWTSILVRTYAWMVLLGRNGILNQLLIAFGIIKTPIAMMHSTFGVYIGMIQILLPYMILPLYSVMLGVDKDLIRASYNLGAKPFQSFVHVYLPLTFPGIISGVTLVFIMALGFFITPALLGGISDVTISMFIEYQIDQFLNWGMASALSITLLFLTGLIFVVFKVTSRFLYSSGDSFSGGRK